MTTTFTWSFSFPMFCFCSSCFLILFPNFFGKNFSLIFGVYFAALSKPLSRLLARVVSPLYGQCTMPVQHYGQYYALQPIQGSAYIPIFPFIPILPRCMQVTCYKVFSRVAVERIDTKERLRVRGLISWPFPLRPWPWHGPL